MSDHRQLAMAAEAKLAQFLSECGNRLWPEDRRLLQRARHLLAREADD
jgi:hypothetical protein